MPERRDSRSRRYRESPRREMEESLSRRSESLLRSRHNERRERYNEERRSYERTHRVEDHRRSSDVHRQSPGVRNRSKLETRSPIRSYSGSRRRSPRDQYSHSRERSRDDPRDLKREREKEVNDPKRMATGHRGSRSFSNERVNERGRSVSEMRYDAKSKRSRSISISPRTRSVSYRESRPRDTGYRHRSPERRIRSPDRRMDDAYHSDRGASAHRRSRDSSPRNLGPEGPSVMVRNLSYETSPHKLRRIFSQWGQVIDVYVPLAYGTGRPRGFGFVEFSRVSMARRAVHNQHHKEVDGRNLLCQFAQNRRKSPTSMRLRGERRGRESVDRHRSRSRYRDEVRHSPDRRR